jgi:hypothetical protein
MVAMVEIGVLIVCAVLGFLWFKRTSVYRLRMKTESKKGERALGLKRELDRQRNTVHRDDHVDPQMQSQNYMGGGGI